MRVFSTNPLVSKLVYQLAPAALVTTVGIVLLSSLARPVSAPPQATPVAAATKTEAVFTPTPRPAEPAQIAEQPAAAARAATRQKPQQRKVAAIELPASRQSAAVAAPLPIAPPATPQLAAAPANNDRTVMGRLRGVTASVTSIPRRAYSKVTGWFAYEEPPRPPAEIPAQDLIKASM